MATYTSYLNLEKPTTSETFNLLRMNQNWDKIDAGVSALNSNILTYAIEYVPFYGYTLGTAKAIGAKPYARIGYAVGVFANYSESRFVIPFSVSIPANQADLTVSQIVKVGAEEIISSGTFDFGLYLFRSND